MHSHASMTTASRWLRSTSLRSERALVGFEPRGAATDAYGASHGSVTELQGRGEPPRARVAPDSSAIFRAFLDRGYTGINFSLARERQRGQYVLTVIP